MNLKLDHAEVRLGAHQLLRVYDALGAKVQCRRGAIWITQLGDRNDYYLPGGESLRLDRRGLTLVHALRQSEVVLSAAADSRALSPGLWVVVWGYCCRFARQIVVWFFATYGPCAIKAERLHGWRGI